MFTAKTFDSIPVNEPNTPLLDSLTLPTSIRDLSLEELYTLADEVREFLLWSVHQTGGHLGAGLGVVELTIALHHHLDTPHDKLIWDVGHQCYPHKILTGRKKAMSTLRRKDGLKGFPSRFESVYDAYGTGHSSTSISAALGMARASALQLENRQVVAVIGDGAMTAGMAYEALCDAASTNSNLLVILNDNDMSISHNTGGLSKYLHQLVSSPLYRELSQKSKTHIDNKSPQVSAILRKIKGGVKAAIEHGTLGNFFRDLGLGYRGIIDGNNLAEVTSALADEFGGSGPRLLHIKTIKGKGLTWAEKDPVGSHSISKLKPQPLNQSLDMVESNSQRQVEAPKSNTVKYQDVFGEWAVNKAEKDDRLYVITPAMCEGSGLVQYAQKYPDRYHDVAIAEQHAISLACGMACEANIKPVVAIYSTFLQRAYDQVVHDLALQKLDVTLAIDRAGMIGEDGPTHAGHYDIALLRALPDMVLAAPSDAADTTLLLEYCYSHNGPAAVRYPRGQVIDLPTNPSAFANPTDSGRKMPIPAPRVLREANVPSESAVIFAFGPLVKNALEIAAATDSTVVDMRFVKPLNEDLILSLAKAHKLTITLEDHAIAGGAGSGVNELLNTKNVLVPILNLGIPDRIIEQATRDEMIAEIGLDPDSLHTTISQKLANLQ